jgi:hypothetical protein
MRLLWIALCAACSSSSFDIAQSVADSATTADSAVTDSGVTEASSDSGCIDPKPAPPPCVAPNADLAAQIDIGGSSPPAQLTKKNQVGFHMRMPRNGRVGRVIIKMIPQSVGSGAAGTVTLQAFIPTCVPRPVGKVTLPFSAVDTWTFEFNNSLTALPALNAGEELTFLLYTDSDAWEFVVSSGPLPSPNTYDLFWATRMGVTGDFVPIKDTMIAAKIFTYACGG